VPVGVTHHELCFGCGAANLFGLQLEAEHEVDGRLAGRFFVKQDHQGPSGSAHGGLIATALEEIMSLTLAAEGTRARLESLEVRVESLAPVGAFLALAAAIEERDGDRVRLRAEASLRGAEARPVAVARGVFVASPRASEGAR
jgi:acyl-coenzyme A thioesterase PaaI-like protein